MVAKRGESRSPPISPGRAAPRRRCGRTTTLRMATRAAPALDVVLRAAAGLIIVDDRALFVSR